MGLFEAMSLLHPHNAQVAKHVNQTAAELAAWSIKWAMQGKAPDTGFTGEELKGFRLEMKGQPIGNSFRPIYKKNVQIQIKCFIIFLQPKQSQVLPASAFDSLKGSILWYEV